MKSSEITSVDGLRDGYAHGGCGAIGATNLKARDIWEYVPCILPPTGGGPSAGCDHIRCASSGSFVSLPERPLRLLNENSLQVPTTSGLYRHCDVSTASNFRFPEKPCNGSNNRARIYSLLKRPRTPHAPLVSLALTCLSFYVLYSCPPVAGPRQGAIIIYATYNPDDCHASGPGRFLWLGPPLRLHLLSPYSGQTMCMQI